MLLSFLGVYVVATKGNVLNFEFSSLKGDIFALLGAVCYGFYSVLGKKYDYEKFSSMTFYFGLSSILSLGIVLFFFDLPTQFEFKEILGIIWLGVVVSPMAFLCWFLALKNGDTAKMSNLIFLTPLVSLIFIYWLLGEAIHISSLVALGLIVGGMLIQSKKS